MFSLLDQLNGWQLLALLAPLMVIMSVIKRREESAGSIKLASLNKLQMGWVFLSLLAPGIFAKVLKQLNSEERESLLTAGGELQGSPGKVALPVLEAFFKATGVKSLPGKDVEEICRWLNLRYEDEPSELIGLYRRAYLATPVRSDATA